ncbi:AlwI family type II restriction endonuclease [Rothia terrae]|uniref:AlwI family type II restriction endonuclease n=1 Tax=Rothia terrae TaxID=396015 RepID=A0A7H2BG88_9MICC|nr:AlwI family type II restriction endonuclease [Rothia terrae]QNV38684.1 AlwI family type II restriction endonuclease [Rothia terrae]
MAPKRKPVSFDTTLRNPARIPDFIAVLEEYEDVLLDDDTAIKIEAEIIRRKIFEPTKSTLGTYVPEYHDKFDFSAADHSADASKKVDYLFDKWKRSESGECSLDEIVYLLNNTITKHAEKGWKGGWQSRLHTQFNFLNELGFVRVVKNKKILISENGKQMISGFSNDNAEIKPNFDNLVQSSFLNAFAKYQVNNPYRFNTVKVNFFPLVLNTIKYLKDTYGRPGVFTQDISFIICWPNNDYISLAEFIYKFREENGYSKSNEFVYEYAMNLLDDTSVNSPFVKASESFLAKNSNLYKIDKIMHETPDEVIRKLRLTMLVSLRGGGRFIDLNHIEQSKINHIIEEYSDNKNFDADYSNYFTYMGKIDSSLNFSDSDEPQNTDVKEQKIQEWAGSSTWEFLEKEMKNTVSKSSSADLVLKYINEPVRLEFLSAVALKKALPDLKVIANYKADDQGIPFSHASGAGAGSSGSDIDAYEGNMHVIVEPTISKSRSFHVEHELPSIRSHVFAACAEDTNSQNGYNDWFSVFLAVDGLSRDVGEQARLIKDSTGVEIYPWEITDFIKHSQTVTSINDYRLIRNYAVPRKMPNLKNNN